MNKQEIKELINKENPFVLDIGCYDGKDSKELSEVLACDVHCFEPDPLSQDLFQAVHEGNQQLILYPFALSNVDGEINFHQSDHPQSNSIHEPKKHLDLFPDVVFDEMIKVKSMRLDTWYKNYRISKQQKEKGHFCERCFYEWDIIDFIWADVNGSEKDLVLGGLKALRNTRYLYIEVARKELYVGQPHYRFIDQLLPDFKMMLMHNWGDNFGNILYKNTKL